MYCSAIVCIVNLSLLKEKKMKKRNGMIVIGLCLLALIGFGGKYYMDEKKEEQKKS